MPLARTPNNVEDGAVLAGIRQASFGKDHTVSTRKRPSKQRGSRGREKKSICSSLGGPLFVHLPSRPHPATTPRALFWVRPPLETMPSEVVETRILFLDLVSLPLYPKPPPRYTGKSRPAQRHPFRTGSFTCKATMDENPIEE